MINLYPERGCRFCRGAKNDYQIFGCIYKKRNFSVKKHFSDFNFQK